LIKYSYNIDHAIAYALYKYKALGYRRLKRVIESEEFLNNGISPGIFDAHIKRMRKYSYIASENSENWKRGQRLPLCLTFQTRQDIRLDALITYDYDEIRRLRGKKLKSPSYSKLKKIKKKTVETPQERREKAYYLMICIASLKTPLPYKDDRYDLYPGVSVTDILGARYGGYDFFMLILIER
jgi:hypothetical protein